MTGAGAANPVLVMFSRVTGKMAEEKQYQLLSGFPEHLRQKTLRYRNPSRREAHILGKLLLLEGILRLEKEASLDELQYTTGDKPYLADGPHFSISHSADFVVCAFSDHSEVGFDIERHRHVKLGDFRPWFSSTEMKRVLDSAEPEQELIRIWTCKEALFKAVGVEVDSMSAATRGSGLSPEGGEWYLHPISIHPGYSATLATRQKNPQLIIEEISW